MYNKYLQLDYIINVDNFQKIQDSLAEATEMAMLTVDYKGTPVTKHSRCSEFCRLVRSFSYYQQQCEKCDSRGGLEATRLQKPYIYLCHMGILDFAIPIIVDGQYIGAVMAGQVVIRENDEEEYLERIVHDNGKKIDLIEDEQYKELYNKLPVMSLDRVKAVANMMFHISNYIVEEALLKINLNEMNQSILSLDATEHANIAAEKAYKAQINLFEEKSNPKTNEIAYMSSNSNLTEKSINEEKLIKDNIILRPALEYVHNNYNQAINLDKMSSLCNISTSYFSKLFKKSTGDTLINYINKVRIKRAKQLLEGSDMPIINIALDIGFEDSGYFIKVFKKLEGVTPLVYRNQYNLFSSNE